MANERIRNESFAGGANSFSDEFATATAVATEGQVEVIHGVYSHSMPLVGMSVDRVRGDLSDRMHIDPQAVAVVNGEPVPEDFVLAEGQVLTFVKPAGEKGVAFFQGGLTR